MTFPLINRIYKYQNKEYILWAQNPFFKVYLRSCETTGGSEYIVKNWWSFMINAKKIGKIEENKNY